MRDDYLEFDDVHTLSRQAVDLLLPAAHLSIEESARSNAYVYPQATGGDHGSWRVRVTIAPGNSAVFTISPRGSPASTLSNLITGLSGACHGEFRGRPFPDCPGHEHRANVEVEGDLVVLRCPADGHENVRLLPALPQP